MEEDIGLLPLKIQRIYRTYAKRSYLVELKRTESQECINPLDPDDHPKEIVNVVSGKVSPGSVNVDQALEIGQKQMSDF